LLNASSANLNAEYGANGELDIWPEIEAIFMTQPFSFSRIKGSTAFTHLVTPK